MKSVIAAIGLAAALFVSPVGAETVRLNEDWRAFLDSPTQGHFDTVYAEVKACTDHDACIHPSRPTVQDADRLTVLMGQNNTLAVRLAIASYALLSENSTAYDDVLPGYGPFIRAYPRRFLKFTRDEGMPDDAVAAAAAATLDQMNDDYTKQLKELTARRAALRTVKDKDLIALRDLCLARVEHMISALTPPQTSAPRTPARKRPVAKKTA